MRVRVLIYMLTRIYILVTICTGIYCVGMRVYKFGCESTPCLSVRFFLTNARSLKYICSLSQYYLFKYGYFDTVTVGDVRSVALSRVYWYRGDVSLCEWRRLAHWRIAHRRLAQRRMAHRRKAHHRRRKAHRRRRKAHP